MRGPVVMSGSWWIIMQVPSPIIKHLPLTTGACCSPTFSPNDLAFCCNCLPISDSALMWIPKFFSSLIGFALKLFKNSLSVLSLFEKFSSRFKSRLLGSISLMIYRRKDHLKRLSY